MKIIPEPFEGGAPDKTVGCLDEFRDVRELCVLQFTDDLGKDIGFLRIVILLQNLGHRALFKDAHVLGIVGIQRLNAIIVLLRESDQGLEVLPGE